MTFGSVVAEKRKALGLSQKQLAERVIKEDGKPISPQYLNDIERDRRNPPTNYIIERFAEALGIPKDYLYLIAKKMPPQFTHDIPTTPEQVTNAFQAFATVYRKKPQADEGHEVG
jgi:transcriptional regulator with XRE-family HTH domain